MTKVPVVIQLNIFSNIPRSSEVLCIKYQLALLLIVPTSSYMTVQRDTKKHQNIKDVQIARIFVLSAVADILCQGLGTVSSIGNPQCSAVVQYNLEHQMVSFGETHTVRRTSHKSGKA